LKEDKSNIAEEIKQTDNESLSAVDLQVIHFFTGIVRK